MVISSSLSAQVYNVSRYTTSDNLVQSQVMNMLQDSQGYLWFGTHRGPCKFDGKSFFALPKDSLAGNFLTDIWEDPGSGDLYFATQSGVTIFDGYHYKNLPMPTGVEEGAVFCMMPDQKGRLWLGTQFNGIILVDLNQADSTQSLYSNEKSVFSDLRILDLTTDLLGNIWIATDQGVYQCDEDGQNLTLWKPSIVGQDEVHTIFVSGNKTFLGTNSGAYLWNGSFLTLFKPTDHGGDDDGVFCFTEDLEGQIWMGTRKGVLYLDQEGHIQALEKLDNSLNFHMRSALTDNEGNIWFGTDGGGARKITPGVFQPYTVEEDLSSNQAKSFLRAENGDIWISTRDRGINIMRIKEEEYQRVGLLNTDNSSIGGNDICYSYQDREGRFWFASYNGTLSRWDASRQNFTVYDKTKELNANAVYVVGEDDNFMWVGTDHGLFRMVNDRITGQMTTTQGLASDVIYALHHDQSSDQLWVGTSTGLSVRDESGKFTTFMADSTVIGQTVIALEQDHQGRLWVGSAIGLAWIKDGKAQRVRISNTDGAHTIIGLRVERNEYLWIATENGVYRLNLDKFDEDAGGATFDHFTLKDGLPSMECNANAVFVDGLQRNIWIGTAEGAIRKAMSQEPQPDIIPPLIYITQVGVENTVDWHSQPDIEVSKGGLPLQLSLPSTQNRVDFSWIGISLRSPQQVEYKFYLRGLETDWPSSSSKQTSISYPNLDPGNYTFMVKAKKEKVGSWDDAEIAEFSFTILPPIYQRWWFIMIMVILLAILGYLVYRFFSSRRRQQQEEQKIRDTSEKLQLEHQALYAMMNPHFTFNALNAIKLFIHRQDRKAADKFLSAFAKLIRMNLESTKSDFISLEEELRRLELFMDLAKVRFPEKLEVCNVEVDKEVEMYETRIPPMLLQPFVENSIEHGIKPLKTGGRIDVLVSQVDDDYLKILIKDNGIGIEASRKAKEGRPKDHVSRGMEITKDRLKLFARITGKQYSLDLKEIKDDDGTSLGTEVEMILPIKYGK